MEIQEIVLQIIYQSVEKSEASNVILDYSSSFKKKRKIKRVPKQEPAKKQENENGLTPLADILNLDPNYSCNPLIDGVNPRVRKIEVNEVIEIPENLDITSEEMSLRKYMDTKRWFCMSRPQYPKSCGITSLVSCWNFLYSNLGHGNLQPLSQEKALIILGIEPPFHDIRFGPFTGNNTLINWFNILNLHFGVKGNAHFFWKLHGKNRTEGIDKDQALKGLIEGLRSTNKTYIYHCYNHYMCPIGYELSPMIPSDAYKKLNQINPSDIRPFIIIGECSKTSPIFHAKKWDDIVLDIDQQNPHFYNIRKPELGVQSYQSETLVSGKKLGGNMHCLIAFERID
ncbi:unnamed protein product [Blepharisma stoltei]|uniref:Basic immunoglobulin-like variable motif-containing protein n=1 Tax=Blepharisma stoltei TaxID=1481888 RepID=A0AAU9KBZ7_9CILI|nr:unnamed protein product [Blepharisma stoltei]